MAESIRVLYVIDSLAPGGAETSLASMAPHLIASGIDLDIAYFHERAGLGDDLQRAGATLHHIAGGRIGRIRGLRRLMGKLDPDVVHTTLFEADQAGRTAAALARCTVVTSYVSTGFELGSWRTAYGLRARSAVTVDAVTARFAIGFHAVSDPVAEVMAHRLRMSADRFTVIPRGREPELLGRRTPDRRGAVRRQLGIGEETPLVLAVGRQVVPKGHMTLVDAMPQIVAAVPDVRVLIAGSRGPQSVAIDRRIDELGLSRHVLQLGHRDDVADLLAAADVLAHPSTREGFPGTLVEALALECPIVASDIAAIRSVVGENGRLARLVPPSSSSDLAATLIEQLCSPAGESATRAGRAAFEERFTTRAVAVLMGEFYATAAGRDVGRAAR